MERNSRKDRAKSPCRLERGKVLIIKPSAIGDIVQALPLLRLIKETYPGCKVSWVVRQGFEGLLEGHPLVDEVILFERELFQRSRNPMRWLVFLETFRRRLRGGFDVAIDLQGLFRSGLMCYASGAPFRLGFANAREASTIFYNQLVRIRRRMHAVDEYLLMKEPLGIERGDVAFPIRIPEGPREQAKRLLSLAEGAGPVVALSPATTWQSKHWPIGKWIALAGRLFREGHCRILLLGRREEGEILEQFVAGADFPFLNTVGKTSLLDFVALLDEVDLVIAGDSAPMHIADALGTSVVALIGPTLPARIGPYWQKSNYLRADVNCEPCQKKRCPSPRCITEIRVEDVVRMALATLRKKR